MEEYDVVQHRKRSRKWIALVCIGLVVIAVAVVLSALFSDSGGTDAPNHTTLFSLPLILGAVVLATGVVVLTMTRLVPKDTEQRNRVSFLSGALLLTTLVICGYIMNPLVSPVTFLRDSDLDGVQDYSDDYPNNRSRVDRPWVSFMMYTSS